jgi:hypothetical protein
MMKQGIDTDTHIRPRPTKLSGVALIVSGAVFLLFCMVPFGTAEGEAKPFAMIFGIMWVLVCLSFIIYGIYILASDKPSSGIVYDIEGTAASKDAGSVVPAGSSGDFEARIRKLVKLKDDRLITEEEYTQKRTEIMKERW